MPDSNTNPTAEYICNYTPTPITIDGSLTDPAWAGGNFIPFHLPCSDEEPLSKTEARMLWDDNYLYVGFKAYDQDIWGYLTERNDTTCSEDVLEIFFKTHPDKDPYFNFEINALGTIYDAYNLKRHAGGEDHHRWKRWDIEGIKTGIFIKGELNNPDVIDEYWQLEVAIPFAGLPTMAGKAPNPGDTWLFHLARYDYSIHLPNGVETSSTAILSKLDFHHCQDWQPLVFRK
jgi:hypothetical protein